MANRLEIVYNIKELMKDHTDDTLMSDRHILFLFKTQRARFLRQLYSDRAKGLDASAIQVLCLDMEKVDRGACGITTNCHISRSKKKLPNLLSLRGRSALISAGPALVGSSKFDIINSLDANQAMSDKYSTTSIFLDDGYLYVVGTTPAAGLIKTIRVQGIFDDPDALAGFLDGKDPCVTELTDYPVPGHMVADINQEVLRNYLQTINVPRDTDNDSVPEKAGKQSRNVR